MTNLHRAVVAAQDSDGTVFYEYGWAHDVSMDMDADIVMGMDGRRRTVQHHSTTIEWGRPPRRSATYPTDADFERPAEPDAPRRAAVAVAPRTLEPNPSSGWDA